MCVRERERGEELKRYNFGKNQYRWSEKVREIESVAFLKCTKSTFELRKIRL